MAGNKNSGRPRVKLENARNEMRSEAINLSWDAIVAFLKSPDVTLEKKMDVASKISVKDMPNEIVGEMINTQVVLWHNGKTNQSTD